MTRGLAFWILMLLWLLFGLAWHLAFYPVVTVFGATLVLFLLLALLGWQIFGPPLR